MGTDIQYCTTEDGVRIAYCVTGEGPPLLVCPYFIESIGLDQMWPPQEEFVRALAQHARLIRFDTRGLGLSGHDGADFSVESLIRDIDAVVAAAGLESFDMLAGIGSIMRAVAYAVQNPGRVRKLVLYEAHEAGADVLPPAVVRAIATLARADWKSAAHTAAGASGYNTQETASGHFMVGEWNRKSATGEAFASFMEAIGETRVADLLQLVTTPTLILHHRDDRLVKVDVAQKVAARIAGSRMRILEGVIFFGTEAFARDFADAIDSFLHAGERRTAAPEAQSLTPPTDDRAGLTSRELEVLRLIVAGKSGREIAAELVLSPRTVERHIANIYRKTDTHGRAQLAGFALRRNIA